MVAASSLSGCPLAKPATQISRWYNYGKGRTIGATVGIVMCQWGVAMVYWTSGHKGPSPQRHKPTKECQRVVHSFSQPSRPSRVTNVGPTTTIDTHNLAGTIVPKGGRTTIDTCCVPRARHRDGVDMPDAGLHPQRRAMHKQHRAMAILLCALRRPTCPQSNAIGRNQAGMQPQQRKHLETNSP